MPSTICVRNSHDIASHEIEQHQQHSDEFPRLNSAFIHFSNRISILLAILAIKARIPPYWTLEHWISSRDIIRENILVIWWQQSLYIIFSYSLVAILILSYTARPIVAFIKSLSQIGYFSQYIFLADLAETSTKLANGKYIKQYYIHWS